MAGLGSSEAYKREDIEHMVRGLILPSDFAMNGDQIFVKGSGIRLTDIDGKEWIDISSGGLCVAIGFGNQELARVAAEQMSNVAHVFTAGGKAMAAEIELASKLAEITPNKIGRFQFVNSGSDANETLFKFARWFWREQGKNKYKFIAQDNSYHGATYAVLATTIPYFRRDDLYGPFPQGFLQTKAPYCYRCPAGKAYPGCSVECADFLEQLILQEGPYSIAGFLSEAVPKTINYGALKDYWAKVMDICKKYEILLIIDEYINSFGRTGKMFASEHSGLKPDMIMFAKGLASGYLPIACLGLTDEIYEGITKNDTYCTHGFTFMGHAVCCAVAQKNLEIIVRDKLVENAAELGKIIGKRLEAYKERHPYIGDVRGSGVFWSLEPVANKKTKEPFSMPKQAELTLQIRQRLAERNIIAGSLGVAIAPPLITTRDEIEYILDAIEYAYDVVKP